MKNKGKLCVLLMLTSLSMGGLVSCGGNPTSESVSTGQVEEIKIASIELKAEKNIIRVGEQIQLTVNILPINANNKSLDYTVSGDAVTVNQNGLVTAAKEGTGTVTARAKDGSNVAGTFTFKVIAKDSHQGLPIGDYTEALKETPYTVEDLSGSEKFGLSDSGNVGVNEKLIVEKYPVISDEDVEKGCLLSVKDITLEQAQKYFEGLNALTNYHRLQTAIYQAKELNDSGKVVKIKLPGGQFDIEAIQGKTLEFSGLDGTYVEGNSTIVNLLIEDMNWRTYVQVKESKNLHFNDLVFRSSMPSSMTGRVVAADIDKRTIQVNISSQFNPLVETILKKSSQPKMRSWVEFDHRSKAPLQGGNFLVDTISSYTIEKGEEGYLLTATFAAPITRPRNQSYVNMAFSQYDAVGMNISNSENIYLENIEMNDASGMALVAGNVHNLYVNRFNLKLKEGSESMMTATADAMHFNGLSGDAIVTNCLIENSHDDALNIKHGYWYKVTAATGGSTKKISVSRITSEVKAPNPGDKIAVYDELSFEGHNPAQGYYTVKSATKTATGFDIYVNERMSDVSSWGNCRVTFLSDTANFNYSNNIVRNKRNRGILIQVPNALVQNNTFMNISHGSIQAASAMDRFNEATLPEAVTIKNNKFIHNCYGKPEPLYGDISIFAIANNGSVGPAGTLKGHVIENNFFTDNGNSAISLRGVSDTMVKDNYFYDCSSSQPSGDTFNSLFHLYNCDGITLDGNYNNYNLDKNLAGITTEGKTVEENVSILDNNVNISFKKNTDSGTVVEVAKAQNNIAIDGQLDDWENAGAHNVDFIGASTADGIEVKTSDVASDFEIKKFMMTHDDKGIYFGFDIKDTLLDFKTVNDFWLGDCIEILMSSVTNMPNADMQVYKEDGGVLQAAFAPTWKTNGFKAIGDVRTNSQISAKQNLLQANLQTTETGYIGEVLIPFEMAPQFKEAIDLGKPIDMAIVVADSERPNGLKRVQIGNVPHFVENYKTKTALMPQYIFK